MIYNTINTATEKDVYTCLLACDNSFIPLLSQRVDIKGYAKKIHLNATNFEAWNEDRLIGLISVYFNVVDGVGTGYITNVCIISEFQKKGLALVLMNQCKQYAIEKQTEKLELEVSKENLGAIRFYQKQNFHVFNSDNNSFFMQLNLA